LKYERWWTFGAVARTKAVPGGRRGVGLRRGSGEIRAAARRVYAVAMAVRTLVRAAFIAGRIATARPASADPARTARMVVHGMLSA
jgi:hypothetical protein